MPNYRHASRLVEFTAVVNQDYLSRLEASRKKAQQPRIDAQGQRVYGERKQPPRIILPQPKPSFWKKLAELWNGPAQPRFLAQRTPTPHKQRVQQTSALDDVITDIRYDFTREEFLLANEFDLPHKTRAFEDFLPSHTYFTTYQNKDGKNFLRGRTTLPLFERVFETQLSYSLFFITEQEALALPPNYRHVNQPFNFYWVVVKPAQAPLSFKDRIDSFTITDAKTPEVNFSIVLKPNTDAASALCQLKTIDQELTIYPAEPQSPTILPAQTSLQAYERIFATTLQYDPQRLSAENKQALYIPSWKQQNTPTIPWNMQNIIETVQPQDPTLLIASLRDKLPEKYK